MASKKAVVWVVEWRPAREKDYRLIDEWSWCDEMAAQLKADIYNRKHNDGRHYRPAKYVRQGGKG